MKAKLAVAVVSALMTLSWFGTDVGTTANTAWAEKPAETSGKFVKKTYKTKGEWRLVKEGNKRFLELSADFKTKQGPDLKVFLSPTSLAEVSNKNAEKDSFLVARLPSHKGKQRIELPAEAKLANYKSLLIHCEKYTVLFAASALH